MELVLKPTNELIKELNRRRNKFSSFRINKKNNIIDISAELPLEELQLENLEFVEKKVVGSDTNSNEVILSLKDKIAQLDANDTESKVISINKGSSSSSGGATKTYNERMKSGFFKRRRSR